MDLLWLRKASAECADVAAPVAVTPGVGKGRAWDGRQGVSLKVRGEKQKCAPGLGDGGRRPGAWDGGGWYGGGSADMMGWLAHAGTPCWRLSGA